MNRLSNLAQTNDGGPPSLEVPGTPVVQIFCRSAKPADVVPGLRLVLGRGREIADEAQVAEFIRFATPRGIHVTDLHVAEIDGWLVWAVLPVVSPGQTMLMLSAPCVNEISSAAARLVIDLVCNTFANKPVQLVQVLIDPADKATINVYRECGFAPMAELLYLYRSIRRTITPPPLPHPFGIDRYSAQTHSAFATAILASYEKSMDCPALNGVRNIEDIIAGHKAAGRFDPDDWFLVSESNQPVAVLLLNTTMQEDGMELVYLGVVPSARGRGLGEYLMQLAESRVSQRKLERLSLAVDAMNEPALKLYYRHGMQRAVSKVAMMKELRGNPNSETQL